MPTRGRSTDLAYFIGVAAGLTFLVAGPLSLRELGVYANDFSGFWAGAHILATGHDPYDPAAWRDGVRALGTQVPDTEVFGYPGWVAVALVPLALLPLTVAATIWLWLGVAVAVVMLRALLRAVLPGAAWEHALFGVALFVAQPGYQTVENGQWTFVLLGASIGALLLVRSQRPGLAALPAVAWLAKPHLFLFAAAGLTRASRTFGVTLAAAVAVVVALSAVLIPGWWVPWLRYVVPVRTAHPATIFSLLAEAAGPIGYGVAGAAVLAGVIVALRFRPGTDAALAVWTALSLAAAPYAWSYDHVLILVPLALTAGVVARADPARARTFAAAALAAYVVVTPLLFRVALIRGRETLSATLPALVFVVVVTMLWSKRTEAERAVPSPAVEERG